MTWGFSNSPHSNHTHDNCITSCPLWAWGHWPSTQGRWGHAFLKATQGLGWRRVYGATSRPMRVWILAGSGLSPWKSSISHCGHGHFVPWFLHLTNYQLEHKTQGAECSEPLERRTTPSKYENIWVALTGARLSTGPIRRGPLLLPKDMLIDFRERGKEGQKHLPWERNMIGCLSYAARSGTKPTTQACFLTRNQTHNLSAYGTMLQPTEPHWSGPKHCVWA